jgi:hypothetical protein
MEATREQIRKLRVDSLYGKKKHFNAADRKANLHNWLSIPALIFNAALASVLLVDFQKVQPEISKWVSALLAITATILTALATFLNLQKQAEGHRKIGGRFLSIQKACERVLSFEKDGLIDGPQLMAELKELASSYQDITADEAAYTTNDCDFKAARKGLAAGEERYLDVEMNY